MHCARMCGLKSICVIDRACEQKAARCAVLDVVCRVCDASKTGRMTRVWVIQTNQAYVTETCSADPEEAATIQN